MNYLLLVANLALYTVQTLMFKEFNKKYMKNLVSYFLFNFLYFGMVTVIVALVCFKSFSLHTITLVLGIAFGILTIAANICYIKAIEKGPLSLTTLLFQFSVLIPTVAGPILWNESMNAFQIVGFILLAATMVIINLPSKGEAKAFHFKWLLYAFIAFLANGINMVLLKSQQYALPGKEGNEFLLVAFGTAALISAMLAIVLKGFLKNIQTTEIRSKNYWRIVLITGTTTAVGNIIGMVLAHRIPAFLQFSVVAGGIILLTSVFAALIYKEHIDRKGIIGLCMGIIAIFMICIT